MEGLQTADVPASGGNRRKRVTIRKAENGFILAFDNEQNQYIEIVYTDLTEATAFLSKYFN